MFFSPIHLDNSKMVINLSECIFQLTLYDVPFKKTKTLHLFIHIN